MLTTMVGGVLLTGYLVKKMEQNNFKKKHRDIPQEQIAQIATIVKNDHPESGRITDIQNTNWQDKTKSQAEPQLGNQRS